MAEYANVQKGALKLKGVSDGGVKKKKKKKDKRKVLEQISSHVTEPEGQSVDDHSRSEVGKRTKAEQVFEQVKQKRAAEELVKKASKSHKERILEFNRKLDNLTEHFDIPKVSWTK